MTFEGPFIVVGNGYFGTWLAAHGAVSMLCRYIPKLSAAMGKSIDDKFGKLAAASLINIIACAFYCGEVSCTDEPAWALTCSVVSFVASVVIVLMKKKPDMKYIPAAFTLWVGE